MTSLSHSSDTCLIREGATRRRSVVETIGGVAEHAAATVRFWYCRHRERAQLAALSDLMLRDIGITRTDAIRLSSKPFWKE